ncbi:MAG: ornithine carbamoyltransferase [Chloroflexi bacterium]|nr:ornithine carbamoyltransferase [Chloroflexota bacterium]MBV9899415.1 ornithine carbamoyltransferase [Chloroflexota bacterium]
MSPAAPGNAAQTAPSPSSLTRNYLSVADLSPEEILHLLDRALELKRFRTTEHPLAGRTAGLVFQKPSLRTRVSFEVAMLQLGGHAVYLSPAEVGLGQREAAVDVARVLSRYVDVLVARVFLHSDVVALAEYASVPVINALSDREHPCQILADLLTLYERRGTLRGLHLAYVGDGNNVAHSLALAAPGLGIHLRVACPDGYEPDGAIMDQAQAGAPTGAIELFRDPREAVRGADAVYTDTWYSMGQESEAEARAPAFRRFQLNSELLAEAKPGAMAMHCLPAHRNQEITDEVMDGGASVVYDQAENRLHVQKALLLKLFGRD